MDDPKWRRGYALLEKHGFSFDLQTPWWHLDAAADLARDFPNTPIIIVHTGMPVDRSEEGLAAWRGRSSRSPRSRTYRSGTPRRPACRGLTANGPVIRDDQHLWSNGRCSPAIIRPTAPAGLFQMIWRLRAAVSNRPPEERRMLFHDNAVRIG